MKRLVLAALLLCLAHHGALAMGWYFQVANRSAPDNIFSVPAMAYVSSSDAGYQAFVGAGNSVINVASDGVLADELVQQNAPAALVLAAAGNAPDFSAVAGSEVLTIVLTAGCAITSTGTAALDATYEIAGPRWSDMLQEAQYISAFSAFSGNPTPSSLVWHARSGAVTFSSTAQFLAVMRGLGDYLSNWKVWIAGGMTGSAPTFGAATIP